MIHYWQHAGADVQDVQQDSQGCVTGAQVPRLNTGHGSAQRRDDCHRVPAAERFAAAGRGLPVEIE